MAKNIKKNVNSKSSVKKNVKKDVESNNQFKYIMLFACGLLLFFLAIIEGESLWKFLHNLVFGLFGFFAFGVGAITMFVAILFSSMRIRKNVKSKFYQLAALFLFLCAQIQTYSFQDSAGVSLIKILSDAWKNGVANRRGGGALGELVSFILRSFLGKKAAVIFIWIVVFVLFLVLTGTTLFEFFKVCLKPIKKVEEGLKNVKISSRFNIDVPLKDESNFKADEKKDEDGLDVKENLKFFENLNKKDGLVEENSKGEQKSENISENEDFMEQKELNKVHSDEGENEKSESLNSKLDGLVKKASSDFDSVFIKDLDPLFDKENFNGYCFPSMGLLDEPKNKGNLDVSSELRANAQRLVDTLKSFGVETRITDICRGPAVTRYELQPSAGVKISKITNLADDISLNLASGGVRIEAPVPNKAAVGIEVPNKEKEVVFLKEVISSKEFKNSKSHLTFAIGKDIAGNVKIADIAKMPHILIAGATGSGKSVCVNSLIVSLLYKSSPNDVRFLMIDPKVVELGVYNGIPHLLVPVVTDPKKASGALSWAVAEMMKRYKLFAETGVREMKSFNLLVRNGQKNEEGQPYEKMPQIVIIIDELADLMMASLSREVENSICRLAQMARAAGMHLVIATQRPSVDVITGLIKANIPSRIAFTVSSQVDSRTILDVAGAEKLLGKGDMLYYPMSEQKPIRVQGCFLSEKEIERVVSFVKQDRNCSYSEEIIEEIDKHSEKTDKKSKVMENFNEEKDPMLDSAIETVIESGQASTSFLQRKLKLGYSRAARIMDELEIMKVVGPQNKSKPREILMSKEEYLNMRLNKEEWVRNNMF